MSNAIRWSPNESSLPMQTTLKGSFTAGISLILFGGGIIGFLLYNLVGATIKHGFNLNGTILLLVFMLFPLGFFFLGISQFISRKDIEINSQMVICSSKGLFGSNEWQEFMSNYDGVIKRVLVFPKSSNQYLVTLRHKNDLSRDVVLWQSFGDDDLDEAQLRFARTLRVAVLEKFDGKIIQEGLDGKGNG